MLLSMRNEVRIVVISGSCSKRFRRYIQRDMQSLTYDAPVEIRSDRLSVVMAMQPTLNLTKVKLMSGDCG